ncbi:MAG: phage major capsid protein [Actinobacteria bacterium]|nr:phage major capsid protein [Actinomycetota bacterium]MBI3687242.1 phage major capsid protein [Actinomycetota bacterium]
MPFPALEEATARLEAKRQELFGIFEEAGPDLDMSLIKSLDGDSAVKVAEIRKRNDEIDALAKDVEDLKAVNTVADAARKWRQAGPGRVEPGAEPGTAGSLARQVEEKSFGELFTDSAAYKGRQGQNGPEARLDVDVKALFSTTTGWLPETTRTGRVVDFATRPIQVLDLIPGNTTSQAAIVYMEETLFTNAAAETAEGGVYAESALQLTEQNSPVRKIATFIPVTDEQLEDEQQARGYLNNRLPFMLKQRLDAQILVGTGIAPNLRGILNTVGIQTQAKGTDPTPDAVYKAMVLAQVNGRSMPNAVVMHPLDWQDVRLLRTADGIYIWGSPSEAGPARLWGLPVAQSDAITLNTGLVGDFANFSELVTRRGVDVQVSNSHSTYFVEGKQAVRADVRVALVVYRPAAFVTVTGI